MDNGFLDWKMVLGEFKFSYVEVELFKLSYCFIKLIIDFFCVVLGLLVSADVLVVTCEGMLVDLFIYGYIGDVVVMFVEVLCELM